MLRASFTPAFQNPLSALQPLPSDSLRFETMGAYSLALRTTFNGFYPNDWAFIDGD